MKQEKNEYDFQRICRACLSEQNSLNSVYDITLSSDKRIHVTDFLRRLTSLKVTVLYLILLYIDVKHYTNYR